MTVTLFDLAPWELQSYCNVVKETVVTGAGVAKQLCSANNQRFGVLFAPQGAPGVLTVSLNPNATTTSGIGISTSAQYIYLTTNLHGPLPTYAWFSNATSSIFVYELIANDWPKEGDNYLDNIAHPPAPTIQPRLNTRPGVDDKMGVVSYWSNLMKAIRGG